MHGAAVERDGGGPWKADDDESRGAKKREEGENEDEEDCDRDVVDWGNPRKDPEDDEGCAREGAAEAEGDVDGAVDEVLHVPSKGRVLRRSTRVQRHDDAAQHLRVRAEQRMDVVEKGGDPNERHESAGEHLCDDPQIKLSKLSGGARTVEKLSAGFVCNVTVSKIKPKNAPL